GSALAANATGARSSAATGPVTGDVVLKIRRRKFQPQFRAGEINVTRRLFRSGDSEYLLNGKLCRLRDIQALFMGTGLGPERYARLRDEMRAKLRVVVASKFAQFDEQTADLDVQISAIADEMRQQAFAVQEMEAELAERTQRGYSIETEIRENAGRLSEIKLEVDRNQAQRRHNEERCNELTMRSASSEAELAQARNRLTSLEEELNSNRQVLESA